MPQAFVAVHVGAGFHSDANSHGLKALCQRACKQAMKSLRKGATSAEAAVLAISILENSPHTNAGVGSNLGLSGTVECDASIMDGHGNFGAVGAVEGTLNPVLVAHSLLKESSQGCLPLGRVPPLVLVGEGAHLWARQHHIATCSPDDLITDRAQAVYLDHMTRLEEATQDIVLTRSLTEGTGDGLVTREVGRKELPHLEKEEGEREGERVKLKPACQVRERTKRKHTHQEMGGELPQEGGVKDGVKRQCPFQETRVEERAKRKSCHERRAVSAAQHKTEEEEGSHLAPCHTPLDTARTAPCHAPLDTVGAICLDMKGEAAAGVSSGGISLKSPGRAGQAMMYGCGCWADNEVGGNSRAVAASTSGTGEYIIKTSLARKCAEAMVDHSLDAALEEQFLNSKRLRGVNQKLAGAIVFSLSSDDVLFPWGHTTESSSLSPFSPPSLPLSPFPPSLSPFPPSLPDCYIPADVLHFSWGHTTESMCIGFMAAAHKEPTAIISKMENPERSGLASHVQAMRIPC